MSVRLLTACLAASALLLAGRAALAKPPDLPNKQKVTCTPPASQTAPCPDGPCTPAGATLAHFFRMAAGSAAGLVPNLAIDRELTPAAVLRFGPGGEEPTPEVVHTGLGDGPVPVCDESTCPYRQQQAEKTTACIPVETSDSVLENLEKLRRAQEFCKQGEFYRRTGLIGAAAFCFESARRVCPGSPIAARADAQMQSMAAASQQGGAEEAEPKPADQPHTCPYLNEKAAREKAKAAAKKIEALGDPLSNLDKLEKAEELYRKALFHQKAGRTREAIACYEEVRRLCPGSRYDDMAGVELKQIAAGKPATTPPAEATEEQETPKAGDVEKAIEKVLDKPLNVHWCDTPLRQALDDVRRMAGLNVVVDQCSLEGEGYHLDSPVCLKVERVAARSVLNLLLMQVNLACVVKDGVVLVTTKSAAEGKLATRTYFVAEFVMPCPKGTAEGDRLVKLLTSTVVPQSWSERGGRGTVVYYPQGKSLVVCQTAAVHEQIDGMLTALRAFRAAEPVCAGEEQEPRKPARPKRKPASGARKKVSQLLEKCHEAVRQGRAAAAARLANEAQALDADAVAADPLVYKMGLLDQVGQELTSRQPFIEPPLPRSGVLAALRRLIGEMQEPQKSNVVIEEHLVLPWVTERMEEKYSCGHDHRTPILPPIRESCPPLGEEAAETKLIIDEPGCLVLKCEDADAARFAAAIEELRSVLLDKMMAAVCAEVDHTRGPTRGRLNVQFGGVSVRAAWDAEGHGSLSIDVPAGTFLEWLAPMAER